MKRQVSILVLLACDIFCIFLSLLLAVWIRNSLNLPNYPNAPQYYSNYINFYFIYIVVIFSFIYNGIYTKRYDFWHESLLVFRSCVFACVLIFCYLALNKNVTNSRIAVILSFALMAFLIPASKFFLKKALYNAGFWQKKAKVINGTREFRREIFKNHYLGYKLTRTNDYETIFIHNHNLSLNELHKLVESNILSNKEIIFTPALDGYDYSKAEIFSVFNSRTSLLMLENSLLKPFNRFIKTLSDIAIVLIALPFLAVVFAVIFVLMKLEEPRGSIFFGQDRVGQDGKIFKCLKFRSMRENSAELMKKYLEENPHEVEYYAKYHKYENDPRITKIGNIMRKTSLDELPQLINVLKGDMSLVGPRPLPPGEHKFGGTTEKEESIILKVKPGITGLWQSTLRNNADFKTRNKIDIYYVKNWTLYMDFVIILKTIKMVLKRDGAS
ncbi:MULTISPECIES: sugar transferase [unclassified Campylobacter]|uniref:sugar transferase n=1 Tax=unclassified Campylobacter TaxID=2593542 RepID=UPI0022E9F417|nr:MULTISPECIES: sugar transferase [unclassified Campylobacter]MDA3079235.1 sugar transferase [Campylobacter sp. CS_NA2]MDA3080462.1 sugar transferase [Campylobacter sp. CS_NA1]MDA3085333.1 sugar transferase [Campylobacter sp. CS_ED1]MDA3090110.1 sugar transferase [Campylobacter sp. CS_ED2]WBR51352.1 sugar transferase [Campylobacter sp. CS_NA3]